MEEDFWTVWWLNILASLITSGFVVVSGIGFNRWRNKKLEKQICEGLPPEGVFIHIDGSVGVKIENPTAHTVVIRRVFLKTGEHGQSTIELGLHKATSPKGTEENERGWVELPPRTSGSWAVNYKHFKDLPDNEDFKKMWHSPKELVITIGYKTILGASKIVDIRPSEFHKRYMVKSFEKAIEGKRFDEP